MRRIPLFIALLWYCFTTIIMAQNTPWQELPAEGLTGNTFKIPKAPPYDRLLLGLYLSQHIGDPPVTEAFNEARYRQLESSLYQQPELREQLFETLGGEFFPGNMSQPGSFEPGPAASFRSYGVELVLPLGRHLALQGGFGQGRRTAKTTFPVVVIDPLHGETRLLTGRAQAGQTVWQAEISGRFYAMSRSAWRPFAGAGLALSREKTDAPEANVAGVRWTFAPEQTAMAWRPGLQAGIACRPRQLPVFFEISGGTSFRTVFARISAGWKW